MIDRAIVRLTGIRAQVVIADQPDGVVIRHPWGVCRLGHLPPGFVPALRALQGKVVPATGIETFVLTLPEATPADAVQVARVLKSLPYLLTHHLARDGRIELSVTPTAPASDFHPLPWEPGSRLRLSRFAYCRRAEQDLILESPLSTERMVLRGPTSAALLQTLARPTRGEDLGAELGLDSAPLATAVAEYLLGTGMLTATDPAMDDPGFAEDKDEVRRQWSFHDLLFHARSRRGRHDRPYGARYRFLGEIPPLPALKPPPDMAGPPVDLYRPDLEQVSARDLRLTEALERRRSVRQVGAVPIRVDQVGEFLYRTARVRAQFDPDPAAPYERTSRPYPSGGAEYELELYLTAHRCQGLDRGVYHYDAFEHRLQPLPGSPADIADLLDDASRSMGVADHPDILVTLAARFQRVAWKYDSIAYSLTLKHVGVVYQTMYLVATAMGLAGCAIGGGDSDLGARVLGLDYLREGTVGEFALGGPREGAMESSPTDAGQIKVSPAARPAREPGRPRRGRRPPRGPGSGS